MPPDREARLPNRGVVDQVCDSSGMGSVNGLEDVQRRLLDAIQSHHEAMGYPPALRELMPVGGWSSVSSVAHQIGKLRDLGLVTMEPGQPRTLLVVTRP